MKSAIASGVIAAIMAYVIQGYGFDYTKLEFYVVMGLMILYGAAQYID